MHSIIFVPFAEEVSSGSRHGDERMPSLAFVSTVFGWQCRLAAIVFLALLLIAASFAIRYFIVFSSAHAERFQYSPDQIWLKEHIAAEIASILLLVGLGGVLLAQTIAVLNVRSPSDHYLTR